MHVSNLSIFVKGQNGLLTLACIINWYTLLDRCVEIAVGL